MEEAAGRTASHARASTSGHQQQQPAPGSKRGPPPGSGLEGTAQPNKKQKRAAAAAAAKAAQQQRQGGQADGADDDGAASAAAGSGAGPRLSTAVGLLEPSALAHNAKAQVLKKLPPGAKAEALDAYPPLLQVRAPCRAAPAGPGGVVVGAKGGEGEGDAGGG